MYVDNMLIIKHDDNEIASLKYKLFNFFDMKDLDQT